MPTPQFQVLEEDRPLSQCLIWPMIEAYYANAGPDAFNETPYYPTNNAYIAEAYAELILAYLEDAFAILDRNEPIYLLELAGGSGVLSFLILQALEEKWPRRPHLHAFKLVYIATDFTERTLSAWMAEPVNRAFFESGRLDCALYWPERETTLTLRLSGKTLGPGSFKNPPIVIANYFFDSIRHDYFQVDRGTLREARIKVMREVSDQASLTRPPTLAEVRLKDRYVPVKGDYYPEADLSELLREEAKAIGTGSFLFPVGALRTLTNLRKMTGGKFGLLSSDKGFYRKEFMIGFQAVPYTPHTGSCSFMVNFHALEAYFRKLGGAFWLAPEHPPLCSCAGVTYSLPSVRNLERAVENVYLDRHLPKSGYQISVLLDHFLAADTFPPLERFRSLLTCTQLACHDPWVFSRCGEGLHDSYQKSEYATDLDLRDTLARVERRLHPKAVGAREAGVHLRRLYFLLEDFERCLAINRQLIAWFGDERDTFYYPAAIQERRGERSTALANYQRALERDPESEHCRDAILRLGGKIDVRFRRPGLDF